MEMVNGYVFLDLTKTNVYSKALKVLGTDKPVVIKDGSGSPYFVDSLTLDGTNVVITKGGKTITIANDNTITNVGDIQNHLYAIYFETSDDGGRNLSFITNEDLSKFLDISISILDDITNDYDDNAKKLYDFVKTINHLYCAISNGNGKTYKLFMSYNNNTQKANIEISDDNDTLYQVEITTSTIIITTKDNYAYITITQLF